MCYYYHGGDILRGHVEKRYKSSWTIVIEMDRDPQTGKRQRFTQSFKGIKKDAEKEMRRLLHEMETGTFIKSEDLTLGEYLERWIKDYAMHQVAPKTQHRYTEILRVRVIPALGRIQLSQLRPIHLQQLYSQLLSEGARKDGREGGLSPRTVLHHHRVIRNALETAVKWQLVPRNVADAVSPPRAEKPEMKTLDEKQVFELLAKIKDTTPNYFMPVFLAVTTGMRRGEIFGLRWQDVDIEGKSVAVRQTAQYTKGKGIYFKEPKTAKSKRRIAIDQIVISELRRHRIEQAEQKLALGRIYTDHGLVICQDNGHPMHPDSVSKWFPVFLRDNYFPSIRFHDLRHTHASIMLKKGVHPKVISERLGHSGIGITMDTYSHLLPGLQEEAAAKLENAIFLQNK